MTTDRQARVSGGFGAGVGAALVMMLVMAILRFTTNTISIPELIERGLISLAGGRVELFFTNTLGVGGKALLLVIIVEGTLLLRGLLGWAFTRLWPVERDISGWRWISGLLYGLVVGLLYNLLFLPQTLEADAPANVASSHYSSSLLPFSVPVWLNMFLLSTVFGLTLVALLRWPRPAMGTPEVSANTFAGAMSRRHFTKVVAGGALALVGGAPLWIGVKSAFAHTSLVTRATHAASNVGWRQLGALNVARQPKANFRESDMLYNPDDSMYYVFSTEGDGNPPPPTPIFSSTADTPTTIIAPGHRLKVGMQMFISGHNNSDGTSSALNNRSAYLYYRVSAVNIGGNPDTFQLVLWGDPTTPVASTGGHGGIINYLPDPHIAMRRASTPEGITRASGGDYVEYVSSGVWYPTVIKEGSFGSSTWHLWGTTLWGTTRVPTLGHLTLKGDHPGPSTWPEVATDGSPLLLGDISVRKNPADGYWYAVALYGGSLNDIRIYRSKDITAGNTWELVGSVFADGHPSWATTATPDPNICFADGRAYVLFTGGKVADQWSTGIVEVDIITGKAKGPAAILLKYGAYPSWMNSVLSDLVFVPAGHDGVDRIFAFGGTPYHSGQSAVWGCLDLPVS